MGKQLEQDQKDQIFKASKEMPGTRSEIAHKLSKRYSVSVCTIKNYMCPADRKPRDARPVSEELAEQIRKAYADHPSKVKTERVNAVAAQFDRTFNLVLRIVSTGVQNGKEKMFNYKHPFI